MLSSSQIHTSHPSPPPAIPRYPSPSLTIPHRPPPSLARLPHYHYHSRGTQGNASKSDLIDVDANLTKQQQDAEGPDFQNTRLNKVRAKLEISLDAVREVHRAMSDRVVKLQVIDPITKMKS